MGTTEAGGTPIRRRAFLGAAVATGALLATGARAVGRGAAAASAKAVTRYPLYLPRAIDLVEPVQLTAKPSTIDLGDGRLSKAWLFNGSLPGPTLRARPGDEARITLVNELAQETIV